MHLASGLSVGLAGVAAGYTIGIVGDAVNGLVYYNSIFSNTASGCACVHAAVPRIRRNDPHIDFW